MFSLRVLISVLLAASSVQGIGPNPSVACYGNSLLLACERGSVIRILKANYGRTAGAEICPHASIQNQNCRASNSLDIVKNLCDDMPSCEVSGTRGLFGDPCCGTYKYLEVTYECIIRSRPVCYGGNMHLSCSGGKVLNILEALYGRTTGAEICPHWSIQDQSCHAPNSLDIVRGKCSGKTSCSVPVGPSVFRDDPCFGTYKYLEVTYNCREYSRVCSGDTLQLSCGGGKIINVLSANYGRTTPDTDICPHEHIQDVDCRASNSLYIVKAQCDGRTSCEVLATHRLFGDPCYGTYKYLEAMYECII